MGEARGIGNDSIGNERLLGVKIWGYTRLPAALQYVSYHLTLSADVAFSKSLHARYEPWILDHVLHKMLSRRHILV